MSVQIFSVSTSLLRSCDLTKESSSIIVQQGISHRFIVCLNEIEQIHIVTGSMKGTGRLVINFRCIHFLGLCGLA